MNTENVSYPHEFDPKAGIDHVKDPVYSYIKFTKPIDSMDQAITERNIIDIKWIQRL